MTKRTTSVLVEGFLQSFSAVLIKHGFERVAKRATFHRATCDGWLGIHAPITRYSVGMIAIAVTAIRRFDAVEKLIVKYATNPAYVDGPNRGTLALYMTADEGGAAFNVEREEELPKAVAWAETKFRTQALHFFNAFPTVEHAFVALSGPPQPISGFDFPMSNERAKRVLAAALVLGRVADLPAIASAERTRLELDPHASLSEFDDFARKMLSNLKR